MIPLVVIFFVVSLFLWNLNDKASSVQELRLALAHKVTSFDPAVAFNDDSLQVIGQVHETLFQYHYLKRPYEVVPSIAASMPSISNGGKVYTIKIRKGIYYHSNTPWLKKRLEVKAQDFVNQIKRLAFRPLKSTGNWLFSGKLKGFDDFSNLVGDDFEKMMETPIPGAIALDDYTLRLELTRAEPNLLYLLCMAFTAPVPDELLYKFNNDLSEVLVGTGAFAFESKADGRITLVRNTQFRPEEYPSSGDRYANTEDLLRSSSQELPFLDRIVFHYEPNESDRWKLFVNREIDILSMPKSFLSKVYEPSTEEGRFIHSESIQLKHFSSVSSRWLSFNMSDPVLGKNLKLRQAIAHAIDFDRYIEILSNNTNLKANSIFNPGIAGYDPQHQMGYSYDVKKAKRYLKESGIDTSNYYLTYSTRGKEDINFLEAQFLKTSLAAIGLKVKIETLDFNDFLAKGRAGKLQFFTDNWYYDYPDAENIVQLLISSNAPGINKSAYRNPELDSFYLKLSRTTDTHERKQIMRQVEKMVKNEIPWIMLMYQSAHILHYPYVQNLRKSYFIRNDLKYLKIR